MEEFEKTLKNELNLLNDINDPKSQELREELGIGQMQEKELLKYKIDFLVKNMGQKNLYCLERKDYFKELLTFCLNKDCAKYITLTIFTCITGDSKIKIYWIFKDNNDNSKFIYEISENGEMFETNRESIMENISNGLRTLSKSRENELKSILHYNKQQKDNEER